MEKLHLGASMLATWVNLRTVGFLGALGANMGQLGANLGPTWSSLRAHLGPTWANLEPTWANLGPTWGQLGLHWGASFWEKRGGGCGRRQLDNMIPY